MKVVALLFLINLSTLALARVPPRSHEIEETPAIENSKSKNEGPIDSNPVERTPVDASSILNDENPTAIKPTARKPIGIILLRQQPSFSLYRDRSSFSPIQPLGHPQLAFGNNGAFGGHDDPARLIRLISLLFGDRRMRPVLPSESSETESVNASSESSESDLDTRRDNPFESLFPNVFVPRFPIETEKEGEATTTNEDKTPANFENKERKVINIGDKKFVKVTQTKKVKNDFGEFHSVISSYQPFDDKLHDENGNEKAASESNVNSKKDIESTSTKPKLDSSTTEKPEQPSSTSTTTETPVEKSIEKEDETKPELDVEPTEEKKEPEVLNKVDVAKNEIPDKNAEIKVDQMN